MFPNTSVFGDSFEKICSGDWLAPNTEYKVHPDFLNVSDALRLRYAELYLSRLSPFWSHYISSIPYVMEEHCRIGLAACSWLKNMNNSAQACSMYFPKDADGCDGRVLSEFSDCGFKCLINTGSMAINEYYFDLLNQSVDTHKIVGKYEYVGRGFLENYFDWYRNGFDLVYCNVIFQFSNSYRNFDLRNIKNSMSSSGVLIVLEKVKAKSRVDYIENENVKDLVYKSKYFDESQVSQKDKHVNSQMYRYMIEDEELNKVLNNNFRYVVRIWAALNFVEYLASDDIDSINAFLTECGRPCIPSDFRYYDYFEG